LPDALESVVIRAWGPDGLRDRPDALAVEEPLEVRIRNRPLAVTMRTPGHDEELAAGFLLSEGLIRSREDIVDIAPCSRNEHGNAINIRPGPLVTIDFESLTRHTFMTSSCGVCGKASIDAVRTRVAPLPPGARISPQELCRLPERMRIAQSTFAETGGLHAAAVFDSRGEMLVLREDVGRHNAVDKAVGRLLLDGRTPLTEHILLVSGRASFEIMQKAAMAGVGIIASVSAPSSLAVRFALEMNQTLIGFLRPPKFNVYTHPERLQP